MSSKASDVFVGTWGLMGSFFLFSIKLLVVFFFFFTDFYTFLMADLGKINDLLLQWDALFNLLSLVRPESEKVETSLQLQFFLFYRAFCTQKIYNALWVLSNL